jgi:hypothetical protein
VAGRWKAGELIVRREVLGLGPHSDPAPRPKWHGRPWEAVPVYVVEDTSDQLVTYLPERADIGFVEGDWPTPDGKHPWHHKTHWVGHGCLMVQRSGDPYAVWHFWTGPERDFACWYINLQADFVRTAIGYDTQDFELDIVVSPDGSYVIKDLEVLDDRVAEGRFTSDLVARIREPGAQLIEELDVGRHWWDPGWARWAPPADWRDARLPADWSSTPCPAI